MRAEAICDRDASWVAANARAVRTHYAAEVIGRQLLNLYDRVLAGSRDQRRVVTPACRGEAMLAQLLGPERFHAVRVSG